MADRIESIDLLRGVAIIGTLGTNIWIFTDPGGIVGFLADVPNTNSLGNTVELLLRYLANGKFLGLLTVLFGVGLELQYRSARRRGARWPGWYLWRSALLLIEGALHFVLVFEGDVLMAYAITSFVVAYLVGRSDRAVRVVMIVLGVTQLVVLSLGTAVLLSSSTGEGLQMPGIDPLLYSEGSYSAQVLMRLANALLLRSEAVIIVPSAVVLFLAGSRLLRAGVFTDSDRGRLLRTRLIIAGLVIAAPLNLATSLGGPGWVLLDRYLLPPIVALGLLGLVTAIALRSRTSPGRCRRALGAVGRCALSCYVFQNLMASALCYGWGLGLAEKLADYRPWWVVALWAGTSLTFAWLAMVCVSRYGRGPLEIFWQWAYQRPMALSRKNTRNARVG